MKPLSFTLIAAFTIFMVVFVPSSAFADENISSKKLPEIGLKEAVDQNIVTVTITGADKPEIYTETVDQEGLHFGKCMAITIKNNIDSDVLIKWNCGTLLEPYDSDVQIMVATHDVSVELKAGKKFSTKFYAMCTQMHLFAPTISESFKVGNEAGDTLLKLVKYLELTYNQNFIGQHAVWAYTDKADTTELGKYGADKNSIEKTIAILNEAGVITSLNKKIPNPNLVVIKQANKHYLFYWLPAPALLILSLLGYYMTKNIKGINNNNTLIGRFRIPSFIEY